MLSASYQPRVKKQSLVYLKNTGLIRLRRMAICLVVVAAVFYGACGFCLLTLKRIEPPTTSVQVQRRIESVLGGQPYSKRVSFVPLHSISDELRHAVLAAEDFRFWAHSGVDWNQVSKVLKKDVILGRLERQGASTITQQLVKNLFLTTYVPFARKGLEFTIAPIAEFILGKERIFELYLNVIEWGPGIYGAEAATQHYYGISALQVNREQAARLAALIPAPLVRKPDEMNATSQRILNRMNQLGW